jgi:excisionase family DNA binding protein
MVIIEVNSSRGGAHQVETDNKPVMTVKDLAGYRRVHPTTVYRQLKDGLLPAFKVGSDWRFKVESIDRWCLDRDSASMGARDEKNLRPVRKGASAPLGS